MTKTLRGIKKRRKQLEEEKAQAKGWVPIRRGARFCSPLCGGGCTQKAYLKAQTLAGKLVTRLGQGWSPQVWENMGWHWAVVRGPVRVTMDADGIYRAELGDPGHQFIGESESLMEALGAVRRRSMQALTDLEKLVELGQTAWYQGVHDSLRPSLRRREF